MPNSQRAALSIREDQARVSPRHHVRRIVAAIAVVVFGLLLGIAPVTNDRSGADELSDKRAEAQQVAAKLQELDNRQIELAAQYEKASYELHQAEQLVEEAQQQADRTAKELEEKRAALSDFSIEAYITGNDSGAANALLTDDPHTGVEKRAYVDATSGNRHDIIDSLNAARQAAETDAANLEVAREKADQHASEIENAKNQAVAAAEEQRAINNRVQGELAQLVAEENARREAAERAAAEAAAREAAAREAAAASARAASARTAASAPAGVSNPAASAPAGSTGGAVSANPPPPPAGAAGVAISAAMSKMGAPYVWAAGGPGAFDCSGLVMWAYAQAGISLPHYSGAQYAMTTRISRAQLQPGDLVFWGGAGSEHVAIYIGGNQLLHTFRPGIGVTITQLDGWWKTPSGYGRLH